MVCFVVIFIVVGIVLISRLARPAVAADPRGIRMFVPVAGSSDVGQEYDPATFQRLRYLIKRALAVGNS